MATLMRPFDVEGLEQALGVRHIVRAEVVFDINAMVMARVDYYLEREQADAVVKAVSEAKKPNV